MRTTLGFGLAICSGILLLPPTAMAQTDTTAADLQELLKSFEAEPDIQSVPLQPLAPAAPSPYRLSLDAQYLGISNARFETEDTISDGLLIGSIALEGTPRIAENLQLLASVGASLVRYADQSDLDFNRINGSLGVFWNFAANTYTRLEVQAQQYTDTDSGDETFSDVAVQFQLGQNQRLREQIQLGYYYQLRGNFADPDSFSRWGNSFNLFVQFPVLTRLSGQLGYRLLLESYSTVDRSDVENQITAELRYAFSEQLSLRGFTFYTNTASNQEEFDVDSFAYGIGFNATFSLPNP